MQMREAPWVSGLERHSDREGRRGLARPISRPSLLKSGNAARENIEPTIGGNCRQADWRDGWDRGEELLLRDFHLEGSPLDLASISAKNESCRVRAKRPDGAYPLPSGRDKILGLVSRQLWCSVLSDN